MVSQVLVALGLSLVGGLSTSIGALFVVLNEAPNLKVLGLLQGFAAGLMLSISFLDLAHNAINSIGFLKGNLWFFSGVIFFAIVANFIPEPSLAQGSDLTSKKGLRVGLNLAVAIALHNIPEGVAVALPVYFATQSKWQAFKLATLSGFAEPLGVIIVAYLFPSSLSPEILEGLLGSVGGVMAFLTLHEMLPLAFDYAGQKQAVKAVFVGMAFMSARGRRKKMAFAFAFVWALAWIMVYSPSAKLVKLVRSIRLIHELAGRDELVAATCHDICTFLNCLDGFYHKVAACLTVL
ncbi:zinc transporter zip11 [Citrus sinensis]|uniref:Zinc transporter zip11 n=1 Tax=Citrus sinensis TaxID=2711 RepID=A0ACB8MWL3_CITSI|nr:zinc transporter zip11 [Citrus sinensis]KAH9789709.1 zinc transporter zip11 [Citrus sinensis]